MASNVPMASQITRAGGVPSGTRPAPKVPLLVRLAAEGEHNPGIFVAVAE